MTDDEIQALRLKAAKAPEGPWFVAADGALESPDHTRSGLSLVETGRADEWPIAQLCEWPTATYLAAVDPQTVLGLLDNLAVRLGELEIATTALVNIRNAGPRSTPQDLRNLAANALKHIEV